MQYRSPKANSQDHPDKIFGICRIAFGLILFRKYIEMKVTVIV